RFGSLPGRRPRSLSYDQGDGRPQRHLPGGARPLRGRCRCRGSGRAHQGAPRRACQRRRDRGARRDRLRREHPGGRCAGAAARDRVPASDGRRDAVVRRGHRRRRSAMTPRIAGLTKLTLETAPTVCHECIWWQTRGRRETDKDRWMEKIELDFGAWGTVYYDSDGRVLGSMQYGPAQAFPRAYELPGGPPSDGSMLVTCAYLTDTSSPWVLQSLFLAAIGEARDRG